jgi:hemerythrin superfamily protein
MANDDVDLIELLERDHRRIDDLAERLDSTADTDEIRDLYRQIVDGLLAHEAIENEVLFPAFRAMLDDRGERALESRLGEHDELNELLEEMRDLDMSGFAFIKRGSALLLELEGHFAREEETVFAPMRAQLPRDELLRLGRAALTVKHPTST